MKIIFARNKLPSKGNGLTYSKLLGSYPRVFVSYLSLEVSMLFSMYMYCRYAHVGVRLLCKRLPGRS